MARIPSLPFVPSKVHVAPVGFEIDRVVEPIIQMRGESAILVANVQTEDQATYFRERVTRSLKQARIPVEVVRAPIFDLYATTETILRVFREHRRDNLYFNASSGSKIQSLSGYIAANLARSEGVTVQAYYAEPESYAHTGGEPLSSGFRRAFLVPNLTVRAPSRPMRVALAVLEKGPLPKLRLAVQLAGLGVMDATRLDAAGRPRDNAARASLQGAVDSTVVRPLQDWGYATCVRSGRHVKVSLTEEGKHALRLYRDETA